MSTVSQPKLTRAESARINGAKSKGPITEEGKQISKMNRQSHGLYTQNVLLSEEEHSRFVEVCRAFHEALGPMDQAEVLLIRRIALAEFQHDRLMQFEASRMMREMQHGSLPEDATMDRFSRLKRSSERSIARAKKEFSDLRKEKLARKTLVDALGIEGEPSTFEPPDPTPIAKPEEKMADTNPSEPTEAEIFLAEAAITEEEMDEIFKRIMALSGEALGPDATEEDLGQLFIKHAPGIVKDLRAPKEKEIAAQMQRLEHQYLNSDGTNPKVIAEEQRILDLPIDPVEMIMISQAIDDEFEETGYPVENRFIEWLYDRVTVDILRTFRTPQEIEDAKRKADRNPDYIIDGLNLAHLSRTQRYHIGKELQTQCEALDHSATTADVDRIFRELIPTIFKGLELKAATIAQRLAEQHAQTAPLELAPKN
jgi:hypothetical protein